MRMIWTVIFTAMLRTLSVQADYSTEETKILALAELTDAPVVRNRIIVFILPGRSLVLPMEIKR